MGLEDPGCRSNMFHCSVSFSFPINDISVDIPSLYFYKNTTERFCALFDNTNSEGA